MSLREEVESIDLKLPLLEQAKKEAAAARNYKEAGNRSKEIKTLQTRREEAEAELAKAREEVSRGRRSNGGRREGEGRESCCLAWSSYLLFNPQLCTTSSISRSVASVGESYEQ